MIKGIYCSLLITIMLGLIAITLSKGVCEEDTSTKKEETRVSDEELLKNVPSIDDLPKEVRGAIRRQEEALENVDYSNVEAIKVNSIGEEYDYINQKLGKQGVDWELIRQSDVPEGDKDYDVLIIKVLATGELKVFKFDITSFY